MKKVAINLLAVMVITGCASKLSTQGYSDFAKLDAGTGVCLSNGLIDYQTAGLGRETLYHNLNTWSYDQNEYQTQYSYYASMLQTSGVNQSYCNEIAAQLVQLTASAENRKRSKASNNYQNISNSIQKPVFCNTIGTMVMCN